MIFNGFSWYFDDIGIPCHTQPIPREALMADDIEFSFNETLFTWSLCFYKSLRDWTAHFRILLNTFALRPYNLGRILQYGSGVSLGATTQASHRIFRYTAPLAVAELRSLLLVVWLTRYLALFIVALKSSCWINGQLFMCHSVFCNMGRRRFLEIRKRLSSITVPAGAHRSSLFSMSYSPHRHPSLASALSIVSRAQEIPCVIIWYYGCSPKGQWAIWRIS